MKPLRIGTRGSALALWQANHIAHRLAHLYGIESELVRIRTSGDRSQSLGTSRSIAEIGQQIGGKGVFIKEIEEALLAGLVDLAVHSMKDVPTETPAGLTFPAITRREDSRDCLISRDRLFLNALPDGARVGTSSLRRQAQLRHHRPDLHVIDLRGNVDTRMKKLENGECDAIVLAVAGVHRLGLAARIAQLFDEEVMLPAVGQGALGIETRANDEQTTRFAAILDDSDTRACITAERALLQVLQAGCQVPLGASARLAGSDLQIRAAVFSADGREFVRGEEHGPASDAAGAGKRLGDILIERGADKILRLAGRTVGHG